MHATNRVEHVARWLAIAAALAVIVLLILLVMMELARVVDVFPPRLARRGLRVARETAGLLPVIAVVFLASSLVARQAATRTWRSGIGFLLCVLGIALLVVGVANLLAPFVAFPSQRTCTFNYDMGICHVTPWIGAPFAAFLGAALLLVGARRNRAARETA